jgi:flavin reductase (DIM6/NTAB) family NADH-FMN oxidoreductase RutF
MDHKKFRDCLGLFSTGVIIACARKKNFLAETSLAQVLFEKKIFADNFLVQKFKKIFAEEFFGMTINSFTSVSLEPPLVLFCIDNKSANLPLFKKNRHFSFNILSVEQIELARAFAKPKNGMKWNVEKYFFGQLGNPIFENSLGFFECKKQRVIKAGDHHIIIAEVLDFGKNGDKKPLTYFAGNYGS